MAQVGWSPGRASLWPWLPQEDTASQGWEAVPHSLPGSCSLPSLQFSWWPAAPGPSFQRASLLRVLMADFPGPLALDCRGLAASSRMEPHPPLDWAWVGGG